MNALHLVRIPVRLPELMRFARSQRIPFHDEDLGYTLHAWLVALFGAQAPKPFRFFERRSEVLGYARVTAESLKTHAQVFASPEAWAALEVDALASKPMPSSWHVGQRLRLEVLACPVSRKDDEEKDLFLRALETLGAAAPARSEVYRTWFVAQWHGVMELEHTELRGLQARVRMLRRAHRAEGRLRSVERPQALFSAQGVILDGVRFSECLARGIGRHRAFGLGMILLSPPR
ncbi:MAG: type I-E CRISPR-associated protein Cas6/Cse3/CasE [Casimicrobiaceae bacterium]|nr:type I-E CRISPR-associated protein Cas6/Cse3/CasE [Casimicrobiaceae bacterium]MCX8098519.1 type I-E CRISPR-associated protein Cas6/Cse3/CasE [Casimicrobiaceae bacterium]MDW8312124.1 type I-E CRISPR-associated protein Cas6/Cse3/CasE [Burkholderiales bacterium]